MRRLWAQKNLGFHDGKLPAAELAATPELESVSLTFVPSAADVAAFDDRVLTAHPACALRLYRLPNGVDLSVLGGLTRIRRLRVEVEPASLDFLAPLGALAHFHGMLGRRANPAAIPWPRGLRHLSLVAHRITALPGLPELRSLELAATVDALDFLADCPRLATLALDGKSTGDLSALNRSEALAHVRVNAQAKVEARHLAPLATVPNLRFVQLMYLPRIADLDWLGEGTRHVELTGMKGLKRITWAGLAHATSLALHPPFGKISAIDLTVLTRATSLARVSLSPLLAKAVGGKAALETLKPLHTDIDAFRRAVHAELGFDADHPL